MSIYKVRLSDQRECRVEVDEQEGDFETHEGLELNLLEALNSAGLLQRSDMAISALAYYYSEGARS